MDASAGSDSSLEEGEVKKPELHPFLKEALRRHQERLKAIEDEATARCQEWVESIREQMRQKYGKQ